MAAIAVALSGVAPLNLVDEEGDHNGFFSDDALQVSGERLQQGANTSGKVGSAVDWEALWDAYIDGLFASCREGAMGSRCDAIGVDTRGAEPAAPVAPITIEDLAAFRPIVGELVVEPDGWGVVGTPTNFYATAESHTMQGELLGSQVTVRWTPTTYAFDYGDGTAQTTEGSGAAWRGTGEQWTETSTSHAYASRDDVTASLTVTFTAEVDAGGGWFAVPGSLPVQAPAVAVKVFEVDTVLTAGDCAAAPTAPGCG